MKDSREERDLKILLLFSPFSFCVFLKPSILQISFLQNQRKDGYNNFLFLWFEMIMVCRANDWVDGMCVFGFLQRNRTA